ncbi:MAG: DUF896 domain-containing protein [Oscillospiraceae bacterium]|nr:DUF896 domain-containing protein [Oscillospiraceae bacterium]
MENTIKRINELAAIAKTRELTDEESAERTVLRRKYIDAFKNNLRGHLDNIYLVDEDGNKTKLKKKSDR